MNHLAKSRKAELDLGRRSKQLAEDERGLVAPDRLAANHHRIHRVASVFLLAPSDRRDPGIRF